MKNKEAINLFMALQQMGDLVVDDLDTALALVENQEKLSNQIKKNGEALKKTIKLSEKEEELLKAIEGGVKTESDLTEDENVIKESIEEKNKIIAAKSRELDEKEFKVALSLIDRTKIPKGTTLKQISALKSIFKEEGK